MSGERAGDALVVLICSGGAAWELPLVRGMQRRELGVVIARRCVDHGELVGTALRDRPRAVLVDASMAWVDRDLVVTLRRAGVEVFAVGNSERPLAEIGVRCVDADATAEAVAGALHRLEALASTSVASVAMERATTGHVVAVWGGAGSPGRTTFAVQLAVEAAAGGTSTLLIDADVWAACVAQLLSLNESPSIAQAARSAADGWPSPLTESLQAGPHGLQVLAGLARAELWPEIREEAWRAVLSMARTSFELVVVDIGASIEEDEELAFDRVPYRRNLVTTTTLDHADDIVLVTGADPVSLRRAVVAHRTLTERQTGGGVNTRTAAGLDIVLNRVPRAGRRLQDCSRAVNEWMGSVPMAMLPEEPAFDRTVWEGRPLRDVAPRSPWLRELRPLIAELSS